MATTNCVNIGLENVMSVELSKLSIEEATQILMHSIVYKQRDLDVIHKIANLYDLSPFGLELANSYLRSHPGLNFEIIYDELKRFAIKLERNHKISSYIINSSPNIASIIERKIYELDESDIIDKLTKNVVVFAGILQIIKADFSFEIFMALLNIDRTQPRSLRNFSETKLRLQELGLGGFDDKYFIFHTFVCEYSKEFILSKEWFSIVINYYRVDLLKTLDATIKFGCWLDYRKNTDSYNLAFGYYIKHWSAANMLENEYLLTHICALYDINYFGSHFSKTLEYSQIGVNILRYKVFTIGKTKRLKGALYLKALVLHQMDKWDDALELYEEIITDTSDVNWTDKVNSLFYSGHIHVQRNLFKQALSCYNSAVQYIESSIESNTPSYYEYKMRCHLYLHNYYEKVGDINKRKLEKQYCEDVMIKLCAYDPANQFTKASSRTDLLNFINKNHNCMPFNICMELINKKSLKPFSVWLPVRCIHKD